MKHKLIEKTEPVKTKKKGWITTVQEVDGITVLNIYVDRKLTARHCVNISSGEHETWRPERAATKNQAGAAALWSTENIYGAYSIGEYWERYNCRWGGCSGKEKRERFLISDKKTQQDLENRIVKANKYYHWQKSTWENMIDDIESGYDRKKRETAQERKWRRINELMDDISGCGLPADWEEWGADKAMAHTHAAMYDPDTGLWNCSSCGTQSERREFRNDGKESKAFTVSTCPKCGASVYMTAKTKEAATRYYYTDASLLQNVSDKLSVMRHFRFRVECTVKEPRLIMWHETIRLIMYRNDPRGRNYKIYYNHYNATRPDKYRDYGRYGIDDFGCEEFGEGNPKNQRMRQEYLYPDPVGITQALIGTKYAVWERNFRIMATCGIELNYNNLMACTDININGIVELLFKGRFYKLLKDCAEHIWPMAGSYFGSLNVRGKNIQEVMNMPDMQAINRLRNINGGDRELYWLRWSVRNGRKISQVALEWIVDNHICLNEAKEMLEYFSPEQMMNYVIKQRAAGYKGEKFDRIISQYSDYINMAKLLGKKVRDELIYKPTDLKARHDEYVELIAKKQKVIQARQDREAAKRMAKEMREKFPTSEAILAEIKALFEWENDSYKIIVPKSLADIIFEGSALHHCAGSTDRYFDRICQHETYICFLRKKSKPKEPYYTIEVEPGGVIRQHRGAYDEEPEIEEVKPALREWQKEIRKRMKKKDKVRAKESERKRIENIEYLKEHINEKKNRFVLKGLEEDLMAL